jgi:ATP-dependent helicase HrpB
MAAPTPDFSTALPIDPLLPEITRALAERNNLVLRAPPGAGKTTRVPLALFGAAWLGERRIVVLEPRRLAARAAAQRMAASLGETVGETVGYRMRMETRVGKRTRIEVVTDGIFLRQVQSDPALPGVGAVLFDEFHERGLDSDLSLALCLQSQSYLREDLRLLAMSATLDGVAASRILGNAPVLESEGRSFPVETRYLEKPSTERIEPVIVRAVLRALEEESGSALVFLPGTGEIRRVAALLEERIEDPAVSILPLYGDLPQAAQDAALRPADKGRRHVVLSTAIAETSVTIEGIRIVIDGGLMRVPRFEPRSGMTRLATIKVSQAAAEQRRGRAGRLEPGICYRMWTEGEHRLLAPATRPEILDADLAPLALELACWGSADPADLAWLDPPPAAAYTQARELLRELGALDGAGRATAHGREMAGLGTHPRLAHMMLKGRHWGLGGLACDIAALLGSRDVVKAGPGERDADLGRRLDLLREGEGGRGFMGGGQVDRNALRQIAREAQDWRRRLGIPRDAEPGASAEAGKLLALAYPDRIAQRRPGGTGQFRLSQGSGAKLDPADPLAREEFLAVAELDGDRREARIFLAAPLLRGEIEEAFAEQIETRDGVMWEPRENAVLARRQRVFGALILEDEALAEPPPEQIIAGLIDGIRQQGLACLPWCREARGLRARMMFLRRFESGSALVDGKGESVWPDVSDEALLAGLESWLAPYLSGMTRLDHLQRLDLAAILRNLVSWAEQKRLDELAPTHVKVPSGSAILIDYESGEIPVLAVRLQELFGAAETPAVAGGKVPLLLHLLSPAHRPLQVTRDLAGFWASSYHAVKAEMKGRYPKHPWPDDPLSAVPTNRAKRSA